MTDFMTSNRLPELAARINTEHDAAGAAIKKGIARALACGADPSWPRPRSQEPQVEARGRPGGGR